MNRGALAFLRFSSSFSAQLTVDEIMARVAENQDRAEAARTAWVYD